jgi:hypothetical protein
MCISDTEVCTQARLSVSLDEVRPAALRLSHHHPSLGTLGIVGRWFASRSSTAETTLENTIIGEFDTRSEAELAVEHVLQECDVSRSDVSIQPRGGANSAGTRAAAGREGFSGAGGTSKAGRRTPGLRRFPPWRSAENSRRTEGWERHDCSHELRCGTKNARVTRTCQNPGKLSSEWQALCRLAAGVKRRPSACRAACEETQAP